MVEINNQRKASLDMLAWSEGTDKRTSETRNHGYDVIVGGELLYWLPGSPSQTCHAKPKTQISAGRYQLLSRCGCLPCSAWPERLLSESQTAVALQQIKERGALLMIDRGDIRRAIDRCSNIWASLPGAGYGRLSIRPTAWLQNSKGGTVREIDVWAESPRLSPLWLSASSSACHGLLIITVITPLPTKPSVQKCQRTGAGERGNYWHADVPWCCCARCKIHEGVSHAKAEMMLCVMMLPLVVVGCTSKQSVVSAWSHHRLRY